MAGNNQRDWPDKSVSFSSKVSSSTLTPCKSSSEKVLLRSVCRGLSSGGCSFFMVREGRLSLSNKEDDDDNDVE